MGANERKSSDAEGSAGREFLGAPDPEAMLPGLDEGQLRILRRVGRDWNAVPERRWSALPVEVRPGVDVSRPELRPSRFGRAVRLNGRDSALEAGGDDERPLSGWGRFGFRASRLLIGPPLSASGIAAERMRKLVALPVLSADALSSVAYGPEAMLAVLVLGGAAALRYGPWIAAVIVVLMIAVGASYRQTVRAYPKGGGSYLVATDNLGAMAGLVAAAGLATDYVLTVAVSVASGVAALTSAQPALAGATVPIGLLVILVLLLGNLRGVRQAGALFAIPTYAFIVGMAVLLGIGLTQHALHGWQATPTPPTPPVETVGVLLVMRAFASGATAMTGVEAISDAIPSFRPTEWRNARATLTIMIGVLVVLFSGTVALVVLDGLVPDAGQTLLSQLAHRHLGTGWAYFVMQGATAAVLLLAANTAYNDFPRLLFLLARNSFVPRMFLRVGDRLAFSNGIVALSLVAAVIFAVFRGHTEALIPLYAVGVFLAFTISQTGMVVHWWRGRAAHWRKGLVLNAIGAALAAIVFVTAGITKFTEGAWLAIVVVGVFIVVALRINHHYRCAAAALELRGPERGTATDDELEEVPCEIRHLIVVPVAALDLAGLRALAYAASLRQPVLALHISPTDHEAERFRDYWHSWGDCLPLQIVISRHRAVVAPLVHYIREVRREHPDLTLTVVLPEVVARRARHRILHTHTASRIRRALRPIRGTVVTTVHYHLSE